MINSIPYDDFTKTLEITQKSQSEARNHSWVRKNDNIFTSIRIIINYKMMGNPIPDKTVFILRSPRFQENINQNTKKKCIQENKIENDNQTSVC